MNEFVEQLAALQLRLKNLIPTQRWTDLMHNAHDRAFVVAGAMQHDLIQDVADAIEKAITQGTTLDEFRRDFDAIIEKHGWSYTGSRNWRTRVIYRTNMTTSYAAGRYAQLTDAGLKTVAPYWMYRHGGSGDPRPQHVKWDKLVLPNDHPWWQVHYPPNGWGCSCYVVAVSGETARRLGGRFEEPPLDEVGDVDEGWGYVVNERI